MRCQYFEDYRRQVIVSIAGRGAKFHWRHRIHRSPPRVARAETNSAIDDIQRQHSSSPNLRRPGVKASCLWRQFLWHRMPDLQHYDLVSGTEVGFISLPRRIDGTAWRVSLSRAFIPSPP